MTTPLLPSATDFDPHVGSTFRVIGRWLPGSPEAPPAEDAPADEPLDVALVLAAVHHHDFPGPFEQFRLTFAGPSAQPLPQDTYLVEHDEIHLESLFLVPSSEQGDTRTYEASFSIARSRPQGHDT